MGSAGDVSGHDASRRSCVCVKECWQLIEQVSPWKPPEGEFATYDVQPFLATLNISNFLVNPDRN